MISYELDRNNDSFEKRKKQKIFDDSDFIFSPNLFDNKHASIYRSTSESILKSLFIDNDHGKYTFSGNLLDNLMLPSDQHQLSCDEKSRTEYIKNDEHDIEFKNESNDEPKESLNNSISPNFMNHFFSSFGFSPCITISALNPSNFQAPTTIISESIQFSSINKNSSLDCPSLNNLFLSTQSQDIPEVNETLSDHDTKLESKNIEISSRLITINKKKSYKRKINALSGNNNFVFKRIEVMRKACERCTNKKIKCIKVSEILCKTCDEKGHECIYTHQRRRGKPASEIVQKILYSRDNNSELSHN